MSVFVLVQLESLPSLVQQRVAHFVCVRDVDEVDDPIHFGSLRLCNRRWRAVCDSVVQDVNVTAEQLAASIPFFRQLPELQGLSIRGSAFQADQAMIMTDTLSTFGAKLTSFHLGCDGYEEFDDFPGPMVIKRLRHIFLPWSHTLQRIELVHCHIISGDQPKFGSPGLFDSLPTLTALDLTSVTATPPFLHLKLAGCTLHN